MAASWKVFWNDDPLPLSVPWTAALLDEDELLDEDPLPDGELLLDDGELLLDEEHAAMDKTTAPAAPPANVTCRVPRSRISEFSL